VKKKISTLVIILVICVAVIIGAVIIGTKPKFSTVKNFEECKNAGYLVMESYPEQCLTPDSKLFVQTVENNVLDGPNVTKIINPASTFCVEDGGKSEIRTNSDGSQTGYCIFENGKECEEWQYFRGECSK
jgi:putative hemolysin